MNALFLVALLALPADWKNVQTGEVPQPGLIRLNLPADTLNAARPGLEDLRILDAQGREVPFTIERPVAGNVVTHRPRRFDVRLENQTTRLHLETGVAQPIDGVTLESPAAAFIKSITVEGSADQTRWKPLATDQPIFRQGGATQLRVSFPAGIWPHLRVTVDDKRADAIAFTGALLNATTGAPAPTEQLPATITDRIENNGQTRLTVDLGAGQQTLATLGLEIGDPLFTRGVELAVREMAGDAVTERVFARGTLFRIDLPGLKPAESLVIPLDRPVPSREVLVLIDNADNPPLQIKAVNVHRRPVFAVFLAQQAGLYHVLTGNPRCPAPRYDLAALAARLQDATAAAVALSPVAANPAYRPSEALPELEDLGTALDVSAWSYRKPVALTWPGVQRLELDLDVLARADANFRDLRVLRAGRQRPYILERTSLQRKVALTVTAANDPKRPTVSRWRLTLPRENLPVTRLTCTTSTPLFRRTVRLYEEPPDQRGEHYRRELGQGTWVRTPPATAAPLGVTLTVAPVTATLYLETDNGDNAPIALADFSFVYPVTRVLFKAPVEPATMLYYGNPVARAPSYDLDLIAPRLLAEETVPATPGAEEALKKSAVGELFALSGTKSVLFWGALVAVVVVLLVVIAKLLPKNPPRPPGGV